MVSSLLDFPPFQTNIYPTRELKNLTVLVAFNIDDERRQKPLLSYYRYKEKHDNYNTLSSPKDDLKNF